MRRINIGPKEGSNARISSTPPNLTILQPWDPSLAWLRGLDSNGAEAVQRGVGSTGLSLLHFEFYRNIIDLQCVCCTGIDGGCINTSTHAKFLELLF